MNNSVSHIVNIPHCVFSTILYIFATTLSCHILPFLRNCSSISFFAVFYDLFHFTNTLFSLSSSCHAKPQWKSAVYCNRGRIVSVRSLYLKMFTNTNVLNLSNQKQVVQRSQLQCFDDEYLRWVLEKFLTTNFFFQFDTINYI